MDTRAARVRANVHAAWQSEVQRRALQRRRIALATIRGIVAAAVVTVVVARPEPVVEPVTHLATVARTEGAARVAVGARVLSGEVIETGRAARVALRTPGGTSIRLDRSSRARFIAYRVIELTAGAMYVDTNGVEDPIDVRTSAGVIRDIGTQFEVRLLDDSVRVRVRSGMVAVERERQSINVAAQTQLTLTSSGAESRALPAFGEEWNWIAGMAPGFRIEGQRLSAFLTYLSRENGWTLHYADAGVQRVASATVLHGAVDGLDAEAALGVALTIADLSHTLDRGELRIWRSSSR
jgi:ferric-dicitrate binding protein FerR (iron transport regulator)